MPRQPRIALAVAALCLGSMPWTTASAQSVSSASPDAGRLSAFASRRAVSTASLASQRGGASTADGLALTGSLMNTSATNVTTGANTITDGAFTGVNGLPIVVQNSGNNVVIQTSTIVNVTVK